MTYNRILKIDSSLIARWQNLQIQNPDKNTRMIAIELGVSEEQLISSKCGYNEGNNTKLIPEPTQILSELAHLGEMKFVTGNTAISHSITEVLTNIYSSKGNMAGKQPLFSPKHVDVQFNFNFWNSVYAINEKGCLSLQFFDHQGHAIYRAYVTKKTSLEGYQSLVEKYINTDQSSCKKTFENQGYPDHYDKDTINQSQLIKSWKKAASNKECEDIIEYYDDDRIAVYLSLGRLFATPIGTSTVNDLLEHLLKHEFNIRITSYNTATEQTWSGRLHHKSMQGSYLQLSGMHFNLGIEISAVGDIWLVRKPSLCGRISLLEIYDKQQNHIMSLEENIANSNYQGSKKWEKLITMLIRIEQYSPLI